MPVEVREYGAVEPRPTGPGRGRLFAVLALVLAVVVAVVVALTATGDDGDPEKAPSGGQSTNTPAPPGGLEVGGARADLGHATTEKFGVPAGFPQTLAGATEFSVVLSEVAFYGGADRPREGLEDLWRYVGLPESSFANRLSRRVELQEQFGLGSDGQVLRGEIGDRLYNDCLPEFGGYVAGATAGSETRPVAALVGLWMPCVVGVGSPENIGNLRISWQFEITEVKWSSGRWLVTKTVRPDASENVLPKDMLRPNVSAAERAELFPLEPGMSADDRAKLFTGWSEKWPEDLLGEEPR